MLGPSGTARGSLGVDPNCHCPLEPSDVFISGAKLRFALPLNLVDVKTNGLESTAFPSFDTQIQSWQG